MTISIDDISASVRLLNANPHNPRMSIDEVGLAELAESIKSQGVLQPLLVTPLGLVVAGHRRLAAARLAGLEVVPVIVRELSVREQMEVMLVENLQRQDLSPIEEARAYKRLVDEGETTAGVGRKVGVTTSRINARLVLLNLDESVQTMFHRGDLPLTLAPVLMRIKAPGRQRQVATMAASRQLTVADVERIVERGAGVLGTQAPVTEPPVRLGVPSEHPGDSIGRKQTIEKLKHAPAGFAMTAAQVQAAFEDVCCACGMSDLPEYCAACPMVMLVNIVLSKAESRGQAA